MRLWACTVKSSAKYKHRLQKVMNKKTDTELSEKADLIVEVDCVEGLQQFCEENTWVNNNTIVDMLNTQKLQRLWRQVMNSSLLYQTSSEKISAINLKCQFQYIDSAAVYSAKTMLLLQAWNHMRTSSAWMILNYCQCLRPPCTRKLHCCCSVLSPEVTQYYQNRKYNPNHSLLQ